jgi:GntR family transcriptional regulator, transcriptional repressor for pyruvate dehydrogenase complex
MSDFYADGNLCWLPVSPIEPYKFVPEALMAIASRSKLSDQIYEEIRRSIESEEWGAGMRLATELELGERYRVSRPVVREALARLKSEKLIDSKRGSGSFVTKPPGNSVVKGFRPVGTVVDLIHGFELRMSVEGDTARLAAARRTGAQLDAIRSSSMILQPGDAGERFGDADFRFHLAIAEATGNQMFVSTMTMLREQILFGMRLTGVMSPPSGADRVGTVQEEHARIIAAIERQEQDAAKAAMTEHLTLARKRLLGFEPAVDQF